MVRSRKNKRGGENLKKCKTCKTEIDEKATKCPHCQADQRAWVRRHPIITGIGILFIIGFLASAPKNENSKTPSTATAKLTAEKIVEPTVTPIPTTDPNPHVSNGTFEVGKDIQPGTYRTRKAASGCYYARLLGFTNELSDIIMNENTDAPAIVTIEATDKGFKSTRCSIWTQDLSAITTNKTTFEDGIFIVGTDIEPGKYKNTGSDGCYFARLSNFGGTLGGIITNENTDDTAIVSIAKTDKGFKSSRCGTWTKIN